MPIPVSEMRKCSSISASKPDSTSTSIATSPRLVNFTAFPARFIRTWRRRSGSPAKTGGMQTAKQLQTLLVRTQGESPQDCVDFRLQVELNRVEGQLTGFDL